MKGSKLLLTGAAQEFNMDSISRNGCFFVTGNLALSLVIMAVIALSPDRSQAEAVLEWQQTALIEQPLHQQKLPNRAFEQMRQMGDLGFLAQGKLTQASWKIEQPGLSAISIITPLQADLLRNGYEIIYECNAKSCGGFDFRYQLDLISEPMMHVDLSDFQYLFAKKKSNRGIESLTLVASRSAFAGYVHMTRIGPTAGLLPFDLLSLRVVPYAQKLEVASANPTPENLELQLIDRGYVVLETVVFESGGTDVRVTDKFELKALTNFIKSHPKITMTLVGHTDNLGILEGNTKLSLQRAESLRRYMITKMNVSSDQIFAEGVGYLSPRDSNQSPEGRKRNRRVEAMINQAKN
ncbi:MAG: outer membrane protein OmpA-like peptidoglycan-associated protein [Paracoccaceae bacterium]|jgi:outer membrane protein OmpA-like peptidoglycan-associated protein